MRIIIAVVMAFAFVVLSAHAHSAIQEKLIDIVEGAVDGYCSGRPAFFVTNKTDEAIEVTIDRFYLGGSTIGGNLTRPTHTLSPQTLKFLGCADGTYKYHIQHVNR